MREVLDVTTNYDGFVFSYGVAPRSLRMSPESRSYINKHPIIRNWCASDENKVLVNVTPNNAEYNP